MSKRESSDSDFWDVQGAARAQAETSMSGMPPAHGLTTLPVGTASQAPSRLRVTESRIGGVLLYVIGFICAYVGGRTGGPGGAVLAIVVATLLFWLGTKLLLRAKRYAVPTAQTLLARDQRAPVVYFRSFAVDPTAAKGVTFTSWFTEEEQLARVMNGVGPFVAIGAPGESLPPLGASRVYATGNEWRQVAQTLATRARIVILRVGSSPGLRWEFENILRWVRPEQIVLLIPLDKSVYEEFRQWSRSLLPCELPALSLGRRRLFRGSLGAVITFERNWTPTAVDLQAISLPFFCRSPAYPLVPVLTVAFGPLFRQLSLPWKPPRYSARMVVTIVSSVVLALGLLLPLFW